jgi:hypothetical protein
MGWMLVVLDVDNDADSRHRLDRAIKAALELPLDTMCGEVWARLKALSGEERLDLIDTLEQGLST